VRAWVFAQHKLANSVSVGFFVSDSVDSVIHTNRTTYVQCVKLKLVRLTFYLPFTQSPYNAVTATVTVNAYYNAVTVNLYYNAVAVNVSYNTAGCLMVV
jgi:hypothetical protein